MSALNNSLLLGADAAVSTGSRSLRFNSADSAYLSRTPASAGNRKTWTWAGWVKRSDLSTSDFTLFSGGTTLAHTATTIIFFRNNKLCYSSITQDILQTEAVYRDASAWYHIVVTLDTTQATASNRLKFYVNGSEVTQFSTDARSAQLAQNTDYGINNTEAHGIGRFAFDGSKYFNGYLADIHFIDGQALDPTSFGEFSATTGVWMPKAYTGSYGTNGFRLTFADNSAATATTLGKDAAGSNNWTPNNLSVTAGAGNDSLVDVPVNGSEVDTGAGGQVRGNYATWNPLITSTNLTNGNLSVVQPSTTAASRYATIGMTSGKWYWEINVVKYSNTVFGIRTPGGGTLETPYDASGYGMGWRSSGGFFIGASNTGTGSMSLAAGDVLGLAFDAGAGTLAFYKNGTLNNTLTASSTYIGQTWFAGSQDSGGGNSDHDVNFGQRPFAYTAPSGFKALCTANLPAPTIVKPSTVMDVKLYTGNGSTQAISGLGLSPDFVWIKARSTNYKNEVYDIVRGAQKSLNTDQTSSEETHTNSLSAFNSDGFALSGSRQEVNANGTSYVAWCWDAGSSTVTNTAGSISSQVRANASAGFSICTLTTQSSGTGTFGHGLNVAPQLVITKARAVSNNWITYHASVGNTGALLLNSTAATDTQSFYWNNTTPTSSVVTLGSGFGGSNSLVAYCFAPVAGYSAFGSYTGNGSADGPFVYTGFRPRWLLIKSSSAGSSNFNWIIRDLARSPSNTAKAGLFPNLSTSEVASYDIDILSNGFKLRSSQDEHNASSQTYIYAAFAESPFQYARAR